MSARRCRLRSGSPLRCSHGHRQRASDAPLPAQVGSTTVASVPTHHSQCKPSAAMRPRPGVEATHRCCGGFLWPGFLYLLLPLSRLLLRRRMLKEREVSAAALEASCCAGCGARICDRYFLLAADRQWHSACLRCCDCKLPLASELTCFSRDGNIYCKEDYYRLFAVKRCARCQAGISASELVMRARDLVYHVQCFTCASCGVPLAKGDHFGMRDELVYCRPHYELLYSQDAAGAPYCDLEAAFRAGAGAAPCGKGRPRKRKLPSAVEPQDMPVGLRIPAAALDRHARRPNVTLGTRYRPRWCCVAEMLHPSELSSSMESLGYDSSVTSPGNPAGQQQQQQRTKRMRTSFKHHQLRTMKSYFAINQNPDAKDLKQLAQKTGLSKRVLQVWFQNARAKWRRNLMRQEGGGQGQRAAGPPPGSALLGWPLLRPCFADAPDAPTTP
ncbi:LIM/homeobox protein Lhx9-like [Schistocerca piceifrons]|uniref:LIM/homeobox protein Lhx9-like n=1 Tax=Schistocerca piceifrons TaxID=274613 RepID=UPI001F5EE223|nr:LIM/homeobox protein Lhx9-like [Schistocerca piceifrons]